MNNIDSGHFSIFAAYFRSSLLILSIPGGLLFLSSFIAPCTSFSVISSMIVFSVRLSLLGLATAALLE